MRISNRKRNRAQRTFLLAFASWCWLVSGSVAAAAAIPKHTVDEAEFFLAMRGSVFQPPYIRQLQQTTLLSCASVCNREKGCDGYNYVSDDTRACHLLALSMVTATAGVPEGQVWLKRAGNNNNGSTTKIALHPDGTVYLAFLQWDKSLTEAEGFCRNTLGARLAPVTSYERLNYYFKLLGNNVASMNAGLKDDDYDGAFKDSRGYDRIQQLPLLWNAPQWALLENPCLTVIFADGNQAQEKPYYNKTACTDKHPWVCEYTNRSEDRGCWMEPPLPLQAKLAEPGGLKTPAACGTKVSFACENGEKFVNDNLSPTATCGPDGYWERSYPSHICTGGTNFMTKPTSYSGSQNYDSKTCYKVDLKVQVSIEKAGEYCGSMGGSVLSFTAETKDIFETLPRDPQTNLHFQYIYSGFFNNTLVKSSGDTRDAEGNLMNVTSMLTLLSPINADTDDVPDERYLVMSHDSGDATWWTMFDVGPWTSYPRIICKFTGC